MNPAITPTTRPNAADLLAAHGVRATGARLSVLTCLLHAPQAMSHLELQQALPEMDRVTLYRALDCLSLAGIAHKIAGDDRVFRYGTAEARAHEPQHYSHSHFKCTRCKRVFCLDDSQQASALHQQLQASVAHALLSGFQTHDIELNIKGWCAACVN
ncbi:MULTISPECIES: Fur family transcriptional regulator [unclassified Undibacterium]|uniref:Fur family transcriptional regulator n=1 Tax=unclassified Undibacterium TaxID=2630295 RepID=UPI002AC8E3D3|nr:MULTISPECIES: Fur family transcriptional regulator [unclassified Undibacterium]MEB0141067.1 Fur family transcriptional regulator [Undibacterium sp. CCC2.1]MEB0174067.1 Fur family transcriptional regulator [Undibacterium sp. CCC1.1]MEB0178027.1 Fur family transcriptional regulator [Undibacterium sp. CCC3.4]MEB0217238.1 Fur family transcriptional regulator [Undibacterium sp. 5I2]WPX45018.1 Fur family transcriptional regulator [Undibacterium sp. CCC3.4]